MTTEFVPPGGGGGGGGALKLQVQRDSPLKNTYSLFLNLRQKLKSRCPEIKNLPRIFLPKVNYLI